jgi:hypothetical protein
MNQTTEQDAEEFQVLRSVARLPGPGLVHCNSFPEWVAGFSRFERRVVREVLDADWLLPASSVPQYSFRLVLFVRRLAEVNKPVADVRRLRFQVIDMAEYCVGLPGVDTSMGVLTAVHERSNDLRTKIAACECIGGFRGGLRTAAQLLLPHILAPDERMRYEAARVLGHLLREQAKLADGALALSAHCEKDHSSIVTQLRDVRLAVAALARESGNPQLLLESGCLSAVDLLLRGQEEDAHWFRQNRDRLLREHRGEYVAIRNGEVLGFGKDPRDLQPTINGKVGSAGRAFVARIVPESFDQAPESALPLDEVEG